MADNLAAPLPDLSLEELAVITVDAGDALAVVTQLVVHFTQDVPVPPLPAVEQPFTYLIDAANGGTPVA